MSTNLNTTAGTNQATISLPHQIMENAGWVLPFVGYDLTNDIHPMFSRDNFPGADYDVLSPALRLASRILMSERSLTHYYTVLFVGVTAVPYPAGSGREGQAYGAFFPPTYPLSPRQTQLVQQELVKMAKSVKFRRMDFGTEGTQGMMEPGKSTQRDCYVRPGFHGLPSTVFYSEELYGRLPPDYYATMGTDFPDKLLEHYFHLVMILLHELAHSVRNSVMGDAGETVFIGASALSEAGFDYENAVFGGQLTYREGSGTDLEEWPSRVWLMHYLRTGARIYFSGQPVADVGLGWPCMRSWVLNLFTDEFWNEVSAGELIGQPPKLIGCRRWDGKDVTKMPDLSTGDRSPNCCAGVPREWQAIGRRDLSDSIPAGYTLGKHGFLYFIFDNQWKSFQLSNRGFWPRHDDATCVDDDCREGL
ncbi:hypothetical protein LTR35_002891 [Friedmanniomyces endolithicus]|nr:hypothetical protein LTS00_014475 [Friedmanniomyces endolithicus]KAK0289693.1 hypothetical protein LTR35_002891 [Friedmanniomyces endolithicus]KAK1019772.1 hypothetical protein LTR54_000415 [Friedmanniomyces endolithicus]